MRVVGEPGEQEREGRQTQLGVDVLDAGHLRRLLLYLGNAGLATDEVRGHRQCRLELTQERRPAAHRDREVQRDRRLETLGRAADDSRLAFDQDVVNEILEIAFVTQQFVQRVRLDVPGRHFPLGTFASLMVGLGGSVRHLNGAELFARSRPALLVQDFAVLVLAT